jgi:hypothetical protein
MTGPVSTETPLDPLETAEAGPKATRSLHARHVPLEAPEAQLATLRGLPLAREFEAALATGGWPAGLDVGDVEIF